jgi:hypothetical protein
VGILVGKEGYEGRASRLGSDELVLTSRWNEILVVVVVVVVVVVAGCRVSFRIRSSRTQ